MCDQVLIQKTFIRNRSQSRLSRSCGNSTFEFGKMRLKIEEDATFYDLNEKECLAGE